MFAETFASIAQGITSQFGGPFVDATVNWPGTPTFDAGGDIDDPGTPEEATCQAQVTAPDKAMRDEAGFLQTDMLLYVLAATFEGTLDTSCTITVPTGPNPGTYRVMTVGRDTAGIGWRCRGRI